MPAKDLPELRRHRKQIAATAATLRKQRQWTQAELGRRIGLSQGHVSNIERGAGSFTAEQFVLLLKLFNADVARFTAEETSDNERQIQNALARFGAIHLHESESVLASEQLADVHALVIETLASQVPRLLTALAPVFVLHVNRISFQKLHHDALGVGLERRLAWVIENTLLAITGELAEPLPKIWGSRYRRATLVLDRVLSFISRSVAGRDAIVDILDPEVRSKRTVDELRRNASPTSERWGIITRIQLQDFSNALRAARDED